MCVWERERERESERDRDIGKYRMRERTRERDANGWKEKSFFLYFDFRNFCSEETQLDESSETKLPSERNSNAKHHY
jgi:hypothetical protein